MTYTIYFIEIEVVELACKLFSLSNLYADC